jgi:hypothetical protein
MEYQGHGEGLREKFSRDATTIVDAIHRQSDFKDATFQGFTGVT